MKTQWVRLLIISAALGLTGCGSTRSTTTSNVQYRNLWIVGSDGSGDRELVGANSDITHAQFSPDGTQISLDTSDPLSVVERRSNIYIASVNVTDSDLAIATADIDERSASWSPDGTQLAYSANGSIVIYTLATGAKTTLTNGNAPIWSPDGLSILFEYNGIQVVSANGGTVTQLATNGRNARWMGNGSVVFEQRQGLNSSIYVVTVPGATATLLASGKNPDVASGSVRVIYERDDDLYIKSVGGSEALLVVQGTTPVFSPDGTQVAYVYTGSSTDKIAVVSLSASGNPTIVATGAAPRWAPNGQKIVYEKLVLR